MPRWKTVSSTPKSLVTDVQLPDGPGPDRARKITQHILLVLQVINGSTETSGQKSHNTSPAISHQEIGLECYLSSGQVPGEGIDLSGMGPTGALRRT